MKNQSKHSNCIEAAGFTLKLNFHTAEQHSNLRLPFPLTEKTKTIAAVIEIHSPETAIRHHPAPSNKSSISGQGEYEGAFDIRSRTGFVIIKGKNAETILLNFLTQVFSELVLGAKGLLLHSACVIKKENAYIFYGPSGAGKSTVCKFSPQCEIASDDLTAIRKINGRFRAWGIPQLDRFPAPPKYGPYPIHGLFRIIKDRKNGLVPISASKAAASALALQKKQMQPENIIKRLELLDNLTDHVPCYELHFKKNTTFWRCIDEIVDN